MKIEEKKIKIDEKSIYKIAATTRGIPRNANSYVARVYDFALVMNNGVINPEIVDEALYVMGINKFGLNQDDMDYMNFLNSNTRAVGVDTICLTLGIDSGSTTTKVALVGEDGSLLYSFYDNNNGSPLKTTIKAIKEIY